MSERKIYVGNVPYGFREEEFKGLFINYGDIESCVLKDGFGFVEYIDAESAEKAIKEMDKKDLDGRALRVERTRDPRGSNFESGSGGGNRVETNNIFVANIPSGSNEDDLLDTFSKYGKVNRCKVLPPHPSSNALSGFVDFDVLDDAIKAHDDTIVMGGNTLRMDYNSRRQQQRSRRDDRGGFRDRSPPRRRGGGRSRSRSPPRRYRNDSPRRRRSRSPPSRYNRDENRSPPRRYRNDSGRRSRSPRR